VVQSNGVIEAYQSKAKDHQTEQRP